jgi:hypothetical protein
MNLIKLSETMTGPITTTVYGLQTDAGVIVTIESVFDDGDQIMRRVALSTTSRFVPDVRIENTELVSISQSRPRNG